MNNIEENIVLLNKYPNRRIFEHRFHEHLSKLFTYKLILSNVELNNFNVSTYSGLEQSVIEHSAFFEIHEPKEVDWDSIDKQKILFKNHLKLLLQNGHYDNNQLWITCTINTIENWLIYKSMYPETINNPWSPLIEIYNHGLVHFISDDVLEVANLKRGIFNGKNEQFIGNISYLVKGVGKNINGLIVDDRYKLQTVVFNFLREQAPNHKSVINLKLIREFLILNNIKMSIEEIQVKITTPLKKTGFIGSSQKGFFFISDQEDLLVSYCFHMSKIVSIQHIMDKYIDRAKKDFDNYDLNEECNNPF